MVYCRGLGLLGGSWVVISGVISRVTVFITQIRGPLTPLTTTHEPPSRGLVFRDLGPSGNLWSSRDFNGSFLRACTASREIRAGLRQKFEKGPRRVSSSLHKTVFRAVTLSYKCF